MPKLSLLPDLTDADAWIPMLLIIPLAVQWWSSYYPGAEPGGGDTSPSACSSAKDEGHAAGATLLFNVAHYALRPWPWILVALASLIDVPRFGGVERGLPPRGRGQNRSRLGLSGHAFLLPSGLLGLACCLRFGGIHEHHEHAAGTLVRVTSFMISMDGSSSRRPPRKSKWLPDRWPQGCLAARGRPGLILTDAGQAFNLLLLLGAGTGGLFLLRWFWWRHRRPRRLRPWSSPWSWRRTYRHRRPWRHLLQPWCPSCWPGRNWFGGTAITTLGGWPAPASCPEKREVLEAFVKQTVSGAGWRGYGAATTGSSVGRGLAQAFFGCMAVYGVLMANGPFLYGHGHRAGMLAAVALAAAGSALLHRKD